jgi:hypothetical protein
MSISENFIGLLKIISFLKINFMLTIIVIKNINSIMKIFN